MQREKTLRDKFGSRIGTLKVRHDGDMEIYDRYGTLRGTYYVKQDETRDKGGSRVGYGNLLATLIA